MKKFIFIIIALVTCLIAVGTLWNQDVRKEQGCGKYQDELAKKTAKINELEDSIRNMQAKIDFYDEAVNWLRGVDDEELERAIRLIRSFPKDTPLP
jgi:peptidoglycan hydrolase CwlO-like protein